MERLEILLLICCCVLLRLSTAQHCAEKMDLVFVIDASGSITDNNPDDGSYDNWQLIKNFLWQLSDMFVISNDYVMIGAVVFSNNARVAFPLLETESEVQSSISTLPYFGGYTNTSGAIRVMTEIFTGDNHDARFNTRPDARDVALLIADGYSNRDQNRTISDAEFAHAQDIELYTVGVTSLVNVTEIKLMSSPPKVENETYWLLPDFQSLAAVEQMIEDRLCTGLPPTPVTPHPNIGEGNTEPAPDAGNPGTTEQLPQPPVVTPTPVHQPTEGQPTQGETANSANSQFTTDINNILKSSYTTQRNTISDLTPTNKQNNIRLGMLAELTTSALKLVSASDNFDNEENPSDSDPGNDGSGSGGNPPSDDGGNPPNDDGGNPPNDDGGNPPNDDGGSPLNDGNGNPPNDDGGSPPNDGDGNPPNDDGGNPPNDDGGNPPNDGGGSEGDESGADTTEMIQTTVSRISTTQPSVNATPLVLPGANPDSQALVQDNNFIAGISVLAAFLFLLLIFVIILICCCCCCKTRCCACLCTSCAHTAYCADHCACCSSEIRCCSLGTIFCCPCGACLLTSLCYCCCWALGGKSKSRSCVTVAPSDEEIIVGQSKTGNALDWTGSTGEIFVTSYTQTSPSVQVDNSDTGSVNFTLVVTGNQNNMSLCDDCDREPCVCSPREGGRNDAGMQTIKEGKSQRKQGKSESRDKNRETFRCVYPIGPRGPIGNHTTIRTMRNSSGSDVAHVHHRYPRHTTHYTRPMASHNYHGSTCCYDPNCFTGRELTQCDFIGDCEVSTGYGSCSSHACHYDIHRSACRHNCASYTGSYAGSQHGSCYGGSQTGCHGCSYNTCQACNYGNHTTYTNCVQCGTMGHSRHSTCYQCGVHGPTRVTTLPPTASIPAIQHPGYTYHGGSRELNLTEIYDVGEIRQSRRRKDKKTHVRRADKYRYEVNETQSESLPPVDRKPNETDSSPERGFLKQTYHNGSDQD